MLAVGVLGPLEVSVDGEPVPLSGRLRTLLVVLAMATGSPLPVDRLATALWGDDLPRHVRKVVHTYLGRLRSVLGDSLVVTEPAGYRLRVAPEQVDALRFTRLLATAAQAPDPASERATLDEALALWRGHPFHSVPSDWLANSEAPQLLERYLTAVERRADLDLADGRPGDLVARLRELTARYPMRESLWVRLLTTLDRSGRPAEALAAYETLRRHLAEELGTDPGPELRRIHAGLLAGQPPAKPSPATEPLAPRQLPADIDGFAGREGAVKALHGLVGTRGEHSPNAVVISAIAGTPGVGKTALAVHWAHQVADRFPDGQLYVNLRGFHPSGQAMNPAEALRGFLEALGVPSHRVPSDLDGRAGLYRSLLAEKRMLVLVDNARDAEQVRPLLPNSPTCLLLVTSRNQLTSLVAAEAARPLVLDLLPIDEARLLLARRLGADRVAAEPAAVDEIINRCARLPLALAIAAAHAAIRPAFPLATVAAQLRDEPSRLDALASGDPATDARAVFSWSYRALGPDAARLFRLLGLSPGPGISAPAAASLAAVPVWRVRALLAELCEAHLLTEHTPGRYAFHDLLRAYAAELAHDRDDNTVRHTALHRLLDHYLHTAEIAAWLLSPHRVPKAIAEPQPGVTPEDLTNPERASAWYVAEHPGLVAAIRHAATSGFDSHAWQLASNIMAFLHRRGLWDDWLATQQAALAAARRLADPHGQAVSHRGIAMASANLGRYAEAQSHLWQALDLYGQLDDRRGQALAYEHHAALLIQQDRHAEALLRCQQALDLYAAAGGRLGQAAVLNTMGWCHAELGDYQQALAHSERAVNLFQQLEDRTGEASTWDTLGYAHHRLGDQREAVRCYRRALSLFNETDGRFLHAETLAHLGDAYLAAEDPEAARAVWQQALHMFDKASHHQADQVRAKLDTLQGAAVGGSSRT